jgi:hypothetical protein
LFVYSLIWSRLSLLIILFLVVVATKAECSPRGGEVGWKVEQARSNPRQEKQKHSLL